MQKSIFHAVRYLAVALALLAVGGGAFFFFSARTVVVLDGNTVQIAGTGDAAAPASAASSTIEGTSTTAADAKPSSTAPAAPRPNLPDLPDQPHLANPPEVVKAIYWTAWTAGSPDRRAALEDLVTKTDLNAVVIDIKDYSGYVSYRTNIPEVVAAGAEGQLRILQPNALIKELHDKGIYVIGRITVFQDPILAAAHPEWAVQDSSTGKVWRDRKGLAWLDPGAQPVWDYHVALAQDAFRRGFDEVNFDYIRFPSDGDLTVAEYPYWQEKSTRHEAIGEFFHYLRTHLPGERISADLFGLTTVAADDLGIGQVIEDAYANFDFVSPMTYPSHYADGFRGYANPADHPYDVVWDSLTGALQKLAAYINPAPIAVPATSTASSPAAPSPAPRIAGKLRPWLQSFDLGAVYDTTKVEAQIHAVEDVLATSTAAAHYGGWLLWDPANRYSSYPR